MPCPHCSNPIGLAHGLGSCSECGRTLVRNLADSTSLKRALQGVAQIGAMTPPPTERLPGFEFATHEPVSYTHLTLPTNREV